jgi:serine/threonine protein kinase
MPASRVDGTNEPASISLADWLEFREGARSNINQHCSSLRHRRLAGCASQRLPFPPSLCRSFLGNADVRMVLLVLQTGSAFSLVLLCSSLISLNHANLQLTGLPPFYDENTNEMYRKILSDPLRFPEEVSPDARSLLTQLLDRDPSRRLGVNGAQDIRQHAFFARHIDWKRLVQKKIQPPFKPAVASAIDTSNFDEEFTSEEPLDSVVDDSHLSQTVQQQL